MLIKSDKSIKCKKIISKIKNYKINSKIYLTNKKKTKTVKSGTFLFANRESNQETFAISFKFWPDK